MATHEIGKFKFKVSKEGLAFRFGDGKTRRISLGKSKAGAGYEASQGDDSDYGYDNGYYPEDGAGYDNYDQAEDGGYYDEPAGDGDGGYYPPQDDGYYQDNAEPQAGAVMEYIENNAWVVLALLLVVPPLGIYLLWRLNRYEFPVRMGASVVSGIWFIIALILIISGIFGGSSDPSTIPTMNLTTLSPTKLPTAVPTEIADLPSAAPTSTVEADVSPSATPLGGNTGNDNADDTQGDSSYVYSPQTGLYYHKDKNCSRIDTGMQVTLVTIQAAVNRNQSPCPLCCGGTTYYATADGKWYHTDPNCQDMKGAVEYSKEAAENEGKTACPVCAGGKTNTNNKNTGKTKAQIYAESITNDKSGIKVYMTSSGTWFHTNQNCQGMKGASEVTLLKALQSGKTGCPVCAANANKLVYCTQSGTYYHTNSTCTNMKNASRVTLAAASVLGKKQCPVCVTEDFYNSDNGDEDEGSVGDGSTAYVYATPNGSYYHTNATCSAMKNAEKVTLLSMIKEGRPACPVCCASASKTVYVTKNGKYYHSYATCSGMKNAQAGTLAQALAYGYKVCPKCWAGDGGNGGTDDSDDGNNGYSNVYVYASENGKYYHTKKTCSKAESDVNRVLLELAIDDGKLACQTCASMADDTVYATKNGKYYHKDKNCQGMTGAISGTLAQALIHGYTACPVCYKTGDDTNPGNKYTPGTSGIDVYATSSGKYYHTSKSCARISGTAVKVTLEAALNNNKSACPTCAHSASRTVYATKGGKYYHYSSSCAGSSATNGTLAEALALGFKACPNCVTGNNDDDDDGDKNKFVPGTSGIKVYATTSGKYFHTQNSCGSMINGKKITLEDALNYGLSACPNCAAAAAKKVYAVEGSGTYHYDASHAGTGAKSGTRAEALALGMKACPTCVHNDDDDGDENDDSPDDEDRLAPKDTKVYIDLSGKTSSYLYHTSKNCSGCGMTGGTAVTLKYALDQGFSDCGYCNPPLGISNSDH